MTNERTLEGVAHLQAAGRELINAARSFLDVAEELLLEPEQAKRFFATLGSMATTMADQVLRVLDDGPVGGPDDEAPPVQRIRVS